MQIIRSDEMNIEAAAHWDSASLESFSFVEFILRHISIYVFFRFPAACKREARVTR
jgi:hypothetical protein